MYSVLNTLSEYTYQKTLLNTLFCLFLKSSNTFSVSFNKDNDDTNNKLRILEGRSRRDNLRFDGIKEWDEESWADTEQNLTDTLSKILGIQSIKNERTHCLGDKKRSSYRTIVAKLSSFKIKDCIFAEAKKKKPEGI